MGAVSRVKGSLPFSMAPATTGTLYSESAQPMTARMDSTRYDEERFPILCKQQPESNWQSNSPRTKLPNESEHELCEKLPLACGSSESDSIWCTASCIRQRRRHLKVMWKGMNNRLERCLLFLVGCLLCITWGSTLMALFTIHSSFGDMIYGNEPLSMSQVSKG